MKSKCQLAGMTYAESTRVWRDFLVAVDKKQCFAIQ
jgi:hypothetical protein